MPPTLRARRVQGKFRNLWVASPTPGAAAGILPHANGRVLDQAADASTSETLRSGPRRMESCHEDICREARRNTRARVGGDDGCVRAEPAAVLHSAIRRIRRADGTLLRALVSPHNRFKLS